MIDCEEREKVYLIFARPCLPRSACPVCGSLAVVKHATDEQTIRDLPCHGKQVLILVHRVRYRCKACRKTWFEVFPEVDEHRSATRRLVRYVKLQSLFRPFVALASECGLDEKTVRTIFHEYVLELEQVMQQSTPRVLGLDELHLMGKPRAMITDIEAKRFVEILPDRKKVTVAQYLAHLPDKETLERCCELYNAALQERRDIWTNIKSSPNYYNAEWRKQAAKERDISYYDQTAELAEVREERKEYNDILITVLRNTLYRVDLAFKAFFRRMKAGQTPGYPRFKSKTRYNSFGYSQNVGFKVKGDRLCLSRIGDIKIKLHRPIEGKMKTATIKREGKHWYVCFACEVEAEKLPLSYEDVGIDLGVTHFAALSDGTFIDNPRYYRSAEKKLAKHQQALSRKKRGSNRRKKTVKMVARTHRKIRNQRRDFLHKASRQLVNKYQVIAFEELQPANLSKRPKPKQDAETREYLPNGASAKAGLNKSILDAAWGEMIELTSVKAAWAGRTVVQVNPRYTSQTCSGCGTVRKKNLDERWHSCECGCELDRDTNAAVNILRLGQRLLRKE